MKLYLRNNKLFADTYPNLPRYINLGLELTEDKKLNKEIRNLAEMKLNEIRLEIYKKGRYNPSKKKFDLGNHFKQFNPTQNVTREICEAFREYMAHEANNLRTGEPLSQNSRATYFNLFISAVSKAYKSGALNLDYASNLKPIQYADVEVKHLSHEEVAYLAEKETPNDIMKSAAMFSIYTGLRFSDIVAQPKIVNNVLVFKQKKTEGINNIPLTEKALKWYRNDFHNLDYFGMQKDLKEWAGVKFHTFRHTNAMILLNSQVDVYTISSILGHKSINSTKKYAKITNELKLKALELI